MSQPESPHTIWLYAPALESGTDMPKEQEGKEQQPQFQEMQILSAVSGRDVLRIGPPCWD